MFSFLSPIFLWAASAAAVPLVLHLMQRRRTVRIPFSTIRFLKLAEKRSSSRIRMENFLLWLVRTLLMLLLALGFAMPMLRTRAFGDFLGKSSRDVGLVIDASYSMDYALGNQDSVWERVRQSATAIIEGLEDGDRLCIFLATDDVKPVIEQLSPEREFALAQVKALDTVPTSSQLAPAIMAAWESLRQGDRKEREIHVITDGQALPWNSFQQSDTNRVTADAAPATTNAADPTARASTRMDAWQPEKIDPKATFFITCLGVPNPENAAPVDIDIQPALLVSDTPSKAQTRLTYCGAPRSTSVRLFVNGDEVASRAAALDGDNIGDLLFAVPPLPAGKHPARMETPLDNLPVDNVFHFLFEVRESLPVLCVGANDDTLFLSKALNPGGGNSGGIQVTSVETENLPGEDLSGFSTVILCNALPLSGQEVIRLEQFVQAGGLLVIFPGNGAVANDYKPWSCLPAMPTRITESDRSKTKRLLRWAKPQHPILRNLRMGPEGAPVVTVRRELAWDTLDPKAEMLILSGADTPFMAIRGYGRGQVLLFTISADRTWAEFPLSPFFLPLMHQVVQYGAGIGGTTPFLWASRSLSLSEHLPFASEQDVLADPEQNSVPIRASHSGDKTLLRVENLLKPGVYTITKAGQPESTPAFAINIDRTESDLTPLKREDIPALIGHPNVVVAGDREELLRLIKEHRVGRTLGEFLLWLALALSIIECFYANLKMKSIKSLSETLGVESSGRIAATSHMEPEEPA